jgi:hypothetical protein
VLVGSPDSREVVVLRVGGNCLWRGLGNGNDGDIGQKGTNSFPRDLV